jgi:hypothetical protein
MKDNLKTELQLYFNPTEWLKHKRFEIANHTNVHEAMFDELLEDLK